MSDDDYKIESADAGASATIPMEAGQIKKGGWVLVFIKCTHKIAMTIYGAYVLQIVWLQLEGWPYIRLYGAIYTIDLLFC